MIPPDLASAFSVTPAASRTVHDVYRASHATLSNLRRLSSPVAPTPLPSFADGDPLVIEGDEPPGSSKPEGAETEASEDPSTRSSKRARLVWTPQLHRRFVDVVGHLGIKNAVPKTIMQLMNVEGLTRENVASHLQKYRLYLKRNEGSDHLFASTPVSNPPPRQMVPVSIIGYNPYGGGGGGFHEHQHQHQHQQGEWSGNMFDSVNSYPRHVHPSQ
ncbi:Two-component response regulator ARR14 [Acorus calamus]|uniref:Two-component response regulator ARR14 n=1 Tax=Acorus calamus TaxID=4465 RepID=A0AAV9F6H3_ACOCL|nr:Two-component response regulator ARR14 [Acorus calamus]